jgi:hypothetical protein
MLIESIFRRKGGSYIPFGPAEKPDIVYHFAPTEDDGAHVCEVTNQDHIDRFLSITEGFREYIPENVQPVVPDPEKPDYRLMTNEDLILEYKKTFGREPGGRMLRETVIKRLVGA